MRQNTGMTKFTRMTRMDFLSKSACALIAIACFASLAACKKTGSPGGSGGNGSAHFFANTEWTGTCHTLSQEYDQPCYLHFISDTGVAVYSTFTWLVGGAVQYVDSLEGHITRIETGSGGTIVDVSFPSSGDQQEYTITGENTLMGGPTASSTANAYNTFSPHLQRCPAKIASVSGTSWSSKKMSGGGPTDGMYPYPDLQTFSFGDNDKTIYYRNGHIITYTPTDHIQILLYEYVQKGPKVYFAGYNEEQDLLIGYFGVLSPDGTSMFASSHASFRLPNYLQTIEWYGPKGVTPIIYKQ